MLLVSQSLSLRDLRAALVGIGGLEEEVLVLVTTEEVRGGIAVGDWKREELRSGAGVELEEGGAAMVAGCFFDSRLYRDMAAQEVGRVLSSVFDFPKAGQAFASRCLGRYRTVPW